MLFIAILMVSGCASNPSTLAPVPLSSSPTAPLPLPTPVVPLTFACPDEWQNAYEPLIEAFRNLHPEIGIQIVSWDQAVGDAPPWSVDAVRRLASVSDTAIAAPGLGPSITRQGLLRDLAPFIEADPGFEPGDFWPGVLDAHRWDSGTWAIPAQIRLQLLAYDKDALKEADMMAPQPDWSYDDFLVMVQALTRQQSDGIQRYGFADRRFMGLWGMVDAPWRQDSDGHPIPVLDDPLLIEQVQGYVDLALRHGVMPRGEQSTLTPAATWSQSVPVLDVVSQPTDFGLLPFPGASQRGTHFSDLAYVMSAGTAYPDAAWQWLAFLSRQPVATSQGQRGIPARRSVVETTAYWKTLPQTTAAACQQALSRLSPGPLREVAEPAEQAVTQILAGEAPMNRAWSAAQSQAWMRLAMASVEPTPTPFPVARPQPTSQQTTVIRFFTPAFLSRYEKAAALFESEHPNIRVRIVKFYEIGTEIEPGVIVTKFPDAAAGSDCFKAPPPDESDWALVLDLDPLLNLDPAFPLDDLAFLDRFRPNGTLRGIPAEIDFGVLWYNRALFDATGVSYPQAGWTLEQFLDVARTLTTGEDSQKQYGFVPYVGEGATFDYFTAQFGAGRFDLSISPPRPLFDTPEMVRAVRWYTDLTLAHGVKPALPVNDWTSAVLDHNRATLDELVRSEQAAMWTGLCANHRSFGLDSADLGVAPLPLGPAGVYPPADVEGYYISAKAQHPAACWEWIKFLTGQTSLFSGIPARRSVLESPAYRTRLGEETLDTYRYVLSHSETLPDAEVDGPWTWADYWLLEAVDAVLGGQPVEDALSQAQSYAERYTQCLRREGIVGQTAEVKSLASCAQEVDPDYPVDE